jgi:ABC-type nitrate/sulfonate/bicarbonate transport system ATPase subunit
MDVKVKNLEIRFEDLLIVDKLSFNVNKWEFLIILWPSWSWKTTILKSLAWLIDHKDNQKVYWEITILGNNIVWDKSLYFESKHKWYVGYVFQENVLLPHLNVYENICFPLKLLWYPLVEINNETSLILEKVWLTEFKHYYPHQLSWGMKKRVELARAFITKPKIIFLDEPFSSLDIAWKLKLYEQLLWLQKTYNTTMVMVTHDIIEAIFLSNHLIITSYNASASEFIIEKKSNWVKNYKTLMNDFHFEYTEIISIITNDV